MREKGPRVPRRRDLGERAGGEHLVDAPLDALLERGAVVVGHEGDEPVAVAAAGVPEHVRLRLPPRGVERLEGADDAPRVAQVGARRHVRRAAAKLGDECVRIAPPALLERPAPLRVRSGAEGEVAEHGAQVEAGTSLHDHASSGAR